MPEMLFPKGMDGDEMFTLRKCTTGLPPSIVAMGRRRTLQVGLRRMRAHVYRLGYSSLAILAFDYGMTTKTSRRVLKAAAVPERLDNGEGHSLFWLVGSLVQKNSLI